MHKLADKFILTVWVGGQARPFVAHLFFGTAIDLAAVGGRLFHNGSDFVVTIVKDIAQQENGPFCGGKLFQQTEKSVGDEVVLAGGLFRGVVGDERFGEPRADIAFALGAGRFEIVEAEAGGDGAEVGFGDCTAVSPVSRCARK